MKNFQPTLIAVLSSWILASCGSAPQSSGGDVIIGENDLVKINPSSSQLASDISSAIGRMRGGCTMSHIGNNIAVTAGHCVTSDVCEESYTTDWGVTDENPDGLLTSTCVEVLQRRLDDSHDYAYVLFDTAPTLSFKVNTEAKPQEGDIISIFSHPRRRTLEFSGWCPVLGYLPDNVRFAYQCDTEGGSSGAAVFNQDLEIVGIHNLGNPFLGYNAGTAILETPVGALL